MDSQRCFDYLLDLMDPEERRRFEAQLTFDNDLAAELRTCESNLADFAEAKATPIEPSPAVWDGIQERLETLQHEPVVLEPPSRRIRWGRFAWPLAACLLLGLNVWQAFFAGGQGDPVGGSEAMVARESGAQAASADEAEQTVEQLEEEIESLRGQVAEVSEQLASERQQLGAQGTVSQLRVLRERRDELESRIEALESYYLTLAELSGLAGGTSFASNTLEAGLGVELTYSQNLLMGPAEGGLWDRLAENLRDSSMVLLSVSGGGMGGYMDAGRRFDPTAMLPPGAATGPAPATIDEPYALAFVDKNSGQAILSMGSLPAVSDEEQLVLWARDSSTDSYRQIAPLPDEASGQSLNLGVRLPEGVDSLGELMVTVEPRSFDGSMVEQPGEQVVLQTVPSP